MMPRIVHLPRWLASVYRTVSRPLYGGRTVDAITVGVWIVMLVPFSPTVEYYGLLAHEAQHVSQAVSLAWPRLRGDRYGIVLRCQIAVGIVRYWTLYLLEYVRHGYDNNAYEIDARAAQDLAMAQWPLIGAVPEGEM